MIRIQQVKLPVGHTQEDLHCALLSSLNLSEAEVISWNVVKRSVDARKKPRIYYVYAIDIQTSKERKILQRTQGCKISKAEKKVFKAPDHGSVPLHHRPVIVGTGPAGLFCGLLLAREGYQPLLLERGEAVEDRQRSVALFWKDNLLNEHSNVQFGEGGAGTFSDGKLNTAVKDPSGRNGYVLQNFVEFGASPEILYHNKPHIGTDVLTGIVRNIRREIISLGGEVRFSSQMTDLSLKNGRVHEVTVNHRERIPCEALVLAIGHSARDTFELLHAKPFTLASKPFAVGLRIEHLQSMINFSQYGTEQHPNLPAADYKLARQIGNGRGVYSFCMCPGGYVVNASSEQGRTVVNGMSYSDRGGANANSAMVVTVSQKDFGQEDALAGMRFQRRLEEAAYAVGNGLIPVQLLGDFIEGKKSAAFGDVLPSIKGSYTFADLNHCLPIEIAGSLKAGIGQCNRLIQGFGRGDAVLSGIESRTSSPIRIFRDENLESNVKGVYPCGEGAGYAGGITSAAMDGLKIAERLIRVFSEREVEN